MSTKGPHPVAIGFAVIFTIIFSLVFAIILFDSAADSYREQNNLPPVHEEFLFFLWTEEANVTAEMIGFGTFLLKVLLPGIAYIFLHPIIGKGVVLFSQQLTHMFDNVFRLSPSSEFGEWNPSISVLAGSVWPLTLIFSMVILIANSIGSVFRSLW